MRLFVDFQPLCNLKHFSYLLEATCCSHCCVTPKSGGIGSGSGAGGLYFTFWMSCWCFCRIRSTDEGLNFRLCKCCDLGGLGGGWVGFSMFIEVTLTLLFQNESWTVFLERQLLKKCYQWIWLFSTHSGVLHLLLYCFDYLLAISQLKESKFLTLNCWSSYYVVLLHTVANIKFLFIKTKQKNIFPERARNTWIFTLKNQIISIWFFRFE